MAYKRLKVYGIAFCLLSLCILLGLTGFKAALDFAYFRGYDPTAPLNVEITESKESPESTCATLYLRGGQGDRVPTFLAIPKKSAGPFPCVIFLHGLGDDKDFLFKYQLDTLFVNAGFAVAAFDQWTCGERELKGAGMVQDFLAFRVRAAHTVNDTRRLIDYLQTRPDIDPERVYLFGLSFGAITGTTATALDPRIRAVVLAYGGGCFTTMLTSEEISAEVGFWHIPAQGIAWYLGSVFDPVQYAPRIAPRSTLLLNGKADSVIPTACAIALQEAVHEPKKVIWYPGDHLAKTDALDMPLATAVLGDALTFLQEEDAKRR